MKKSIFYDHLLTAAKQENQPISEIIDFAAELGFIGADVGWCGENALTQTYELLKKSGIAISSVYRFWNFGESYNKDDARAFFSCLRKCECNTAMIIPRKTNGTDEATEFERTVYALNDLCNMAEEKGITVTVEDFDGTNVVVCNTDSLKRVFNAVPKLMHAFDTGNYSYFSESPIEAYKLFKDRIVQVHLKDRTFFSTNNGTPTTFVNGRVVYPCAVGEGFVEIEECIKLLCKNGYNGYLSVELFWHNNMKEAIQKSAEYIDKITQNF